MKHTLLSTASAIAFTALMAASMPSASYAASVNLYVSSVAELEATSYYKAADAGIKAEMKNFVTQALNGGKANSITNGAYQLNVVSAAQSAAIHDAAVVNAKGVNYQPSSYDSLYAAGDTKASLVQKITAALQKDPKNAAAIAAYTPSQKALFDQKVAEIAQIEASNALGRKGINADGTVVPGTTPMTKVQLERAVSGVTAAMAADTRGTTPRESYIAQINYYQSKLDALNGVTTKTDSAPTTQAQPADNSAAIAKDANMRLAAQVIPPVGSIRTFSQVGSMPGKSQGASYNYTIDSNGVVKDSKGKILGAIDKQGNAYDANLKPISDPQGNFISMLDGQTATVTPTSAAPTKFVGVGSTGTIRSTDMPPRTPYETSLTGKSPVATTDPVNVQEIDDNAPLTIDSEGVISHNPIKVGPSQNPVVTPATISLPARGNMRRLARGNTLDAEGYVKDNRGVVLGRVLDNGSLLNAAGKPATKEEAIALLNIAHTTPNADIKTAQNTGPALKPQVSDGLVVIPGNTAGTGTVKTDAVAGVAETVKGTTSTYYGGANNRDLSTDVDKVRENLKNASANGTAPAVTNQQIDTFIHDNLNDPTKIATAMKQYNVDLTRIQLAGGFTRQEMTNYINKSGNADLKAALSQWSTATPTATNVQIDSYIRDTIKEPAKIAAAMKQYNVDLARIQLATGYTRQQMEDYINKSGNADLKAALANWPAQSSTGAWYSSLPTYMQGTNGGQPAAVVRSEADIDKLPIWSSMSASDVTKYKDQIKTALRGAEESGGTFLMGMPGGAQVSVPGRNDSQHAYPSTGTQASTGTGTTPTSTAAPVTSTQINDYINTNLNDPAKIASAMVQYNVGLDRIQAATGYTPEQMASYINNSNNPGLKAALAQWKPAATPVSNVTPVSNTQVNDYIKGNLNEPAKIAAAMKQYNVGLDRIAQVTGYNKQQITDYINNSGDPDLKEFLGNWK